MEYNGRPYGSEDVLGVLLQRARGRGGEGNLYFRTCTVSDVVFAGKDADEPFTQAEFNDGNWHYFVGMHDGATSSLFVDGRLIESLANDGGIYDSFTDMLIGRRPYPASPEAYNGLIGGPLTISHISESGGMFSRWDIDEGAGTSLLPSMGTIDGRFENNITWQATGPPNLAMPAHALDLGASSEGKVWLGDSSLLNPEHITVAFWAKASGNHSQSILASKWNTGVPTDSSWEFGFSGPPGGEGNLYFRTHTAGGEVFVGRDVDQSFTQAEFDDGQ